MDENLCFGKVKVVAGAHAVRLFYIAVPYSHSVLLKLGGDLLCPSSFVLVLDFTFSEDRNLNMTLTTHSLFSPLFSGTHSPELKIFRNLTVSFDPWRNRLKKVVLLQDALRRLKIAVERPSAHLKARILQ